MVPAHWGARVGDLIAMVPAVFPCPDQKVSATGVGGAEALDACFS